jgi:hypothetical protein
LERAETRQQYQPIADVAASRPYSPWHARRKARPRIAVLAFNNILHLQSPFL